MIPYEKKIEIFKIKFLYLYLYILILDDLEGDLSILWISYSFLELKEDEY